MPDRKHDQNHPAATPELEALAARLLESYRKEAELYRAVLKLTELQRTSLEGSGDVRDFIALLHKKEDLIRAIDRLEMKLDDDKARWLAAAEKDRGGVGAELNSILDEVIITIERIMQLEQSNEQLLKTRKDEIEAELEKIRQSRKAAEAYASKKDAKLISAIS